MYLLIFLIESSRIEIFYILASTFNYVNEKIFITKTPFLKYYKNAKTKRNVYLKKFLCQFQDISAKNINLSTTFFKSM